MLHAPTVICTGDDTVEDLLPETYRFALDNTVDSVVITDMDSVIQYVNPGFTAITGFSAEEAIGKKPQRCEMGNFSR